MMSVNNSKQMDIYKINIEQYIPKEHLVRKLKKAIDWNKIREIAKPYYHESKGRPSIDPVILFKMVMINYIFGLHSMRKTEQEIIVNLAYRWFLDLEIDDKVPDYSTYSKNYERRFKGTTVFKEIFEYILNECAKNKLLKLDSIFVDSTHIKANANKNKYENQLINLEAKVYQEELEVEINQTRDFYEQKSRQINHYGEEKNRKVSTVDPESGLFHKGEKEKCFAYTSSVICDEKGFVIKQNITAGNVHDSKSFHEVYNMLSEKERASILNVVADSGYINPYLIRRIVKDGFVPIMPYKRPMTKKGYFKKYEYVYDEYYDEYICPNNKVLTYKTTEKNGYKKYESKAYNCENCPFKDGCTKSATKVILRHIWEEYIELKEEIRHSAVYAEEYPKRSKTIERIFGDLKEKFNLRYTRYRGKEKVNNDLTLAFACMNLKKMATWLYKDVETSSENMFLFMKTLVFLEIFDN
ncbi:MAG: IS1182 family transposase [Firmicutes bacterium]|nr:IS1182 family transposase [Bacillota bacterium]